MWRTSVCGVLLVYTWSNDPDLDGSTWGMWLVNATHAPLLL